MKTFSKYWNSQTVRLSPNVTNRPYSFRRRPDRQARAVAAGGNDESHTCRDRHVNHSRNLSVLCSAEHDGFVPSYSRSLCAYCRTVSPGKPSATRGTGDVSLSLAY